MEKLISYFFFDYRSKIQSIWFKRLLYVYLILRVLLWLNHFDLLFGENSIIFSSPKSIGFLKDPAFILYSHTGVYLSLTFLISLLLVSILNLVTTKFSLLTDIMIWFMVLNIHNKLYPSLTGGDLLLNQFLFFNCFISPTFIRSESQLNALKICLHNMAVIAVMVQLCIVYFLSGLAKAGDTGWITGSAINAVSQIRHFSMFSFLRYDPALSPIYISLNYLVLFYQLLFPLFIWIKKIKKPILILGILMHIYIGLVMGLPEFSAIMVISYVYFWPVKVSSHIN